MSGLDFLIPVDSLRFFSPEVFEQMLKKRAQMGFAGKSILVANGLPEGEFTELEVQLKKFRDVVLIELSKRFGEGQAVLAGLTEVRAEQVFISGASSAKSLEILLDAMANDPSGDLYWGVPPADNGFSVGLFRLMTGVPVPGLAAWPCLMSRAFAQDLLKFGEAEVFLPAAFERIGRVQKTVSIPAEENVSPREGLMYAIRNSSERPMNILFALGVLIFSLTLLGSALVFVFRLENELLPGWASIIILLSLTFGTVIFALGWIALYTGRIYSEIKKRPIELINKVYEAPMISRLAIRLRPVLDTDLTHTLKWHNDPSLAAQILSYPPPIAIETEKKWLRGLADLEREGRRWVRIIEVVRDGAPTPLGFVDLKPIDQRLGEYGFGILVGESEWRGQGVGKQAIQLLKNWAREQFQAQQLSLVVRQDNERAIRFYSDLGFTKTGTETSVRNNESIILRKMSLRLT